MYAADLFPKLIARFPDVKPASLPEKFIRDPEAQLVVPPATLHALCAFLRDDAECAFDLPNFMTAVDYVKENRFELVYALYSVRHKRGLVLKTSVERTNPVIDSVTDVWPGMNWQEREVFDLFGIEFRHHPNLARIMLWPGFPGHPLRKDYVHVTDRFDSGVEVGTPGLDEKGLPAAKGA